MGSSMPWLLDTSTGSIPDLGWDLRWRVALPVVICDTSSNITKRNKVRASQVANDVASDKSLGFTGELALEEALKDLGVQVKGGHRGVTELLTKIDKDNNGRVSLQEFKTLFDASRLKQVFEEIDADGSGSISASEMQNALRKLGVSASGSQAQKMIEKVDTSKDGEVSWDEFFQAFKLVPLASMQQVAEQWAGLHSVDVGSDLSGPMPTPGLKVWQTVLAGGLAGVASRTATAPLERIKLAAQTRGLSMSASALEFNRILRAEGARGLFAGNLTNCIRVFPTGALTCTIYQNLLRYTPADDKMDAMEPVYRMSCAAVAGLVANSATYPLDVIRARLTLPDSSGSKYHGLVSGLSQMVKQEGVGSLYKGLRPTLYAVVPFVSVQLATIDIVKASVGELGVSPSPLVFVASGAVAGIAAQSVIYPLDVLRRRMQLGPEARGAIVADRTWLALTSVVRNEGVNSLFAGIVPTFAKTIPAVAVNAGVCVTLVSHFKAQNKKEAAKL